LILPIRLDISAFNEGDFTYRGNAGQPAPPGVGCFGVEYK
jgi:hypothetical protein